MRKFHTLGAVVLALLLCGCESGRVAVHADPRGRIGVEVAGSRSAASATMWQRPSPEQELAAVKQAMGLTLGGPPVNAEYSGQYVVPSAAAIPASCKAVTTIHEVVNGRGWNFVRCLDQSPRR